MGSLSRDVLLDRRTLEIGPVPRWSEVRKFLGRHFLGNGRSPVKGFGKPER